MKKPVEWHYFELILRKLTFWPDDLEDDLAWPCIIYIWNLYEKSSWMIPCTTQSEKIDFWPLLTFTDLGWLCMLVNHIFLKTTWKIKLNDTLHSSNWKSWFLTSWPWRWPRIMVNHIFLKTTWKIGLIDTLPNSIW